MTQTYTAMTVKRVTILTTKVFAIVFTQVRINIEYFINVSIHIIRSTYSIMCSAEYRFNLQLNRSKQRVEHIAKITHNCEHFSLLDHLTLCISLEIDCKIRYDFYCQQFNLLLVDHLLNAENSLNTFGIERDDSFSEVISTKLFSIII